MMLERVQVIREREAKRLGMNWEQQLEHLQFKPKQPKNGQNVIAPSPQHDPLTPAMEEVMKKRQERISMEIETPPTPEPSDQSGQESDGSESDLSSHEEYRPKRSPGNKKMSPPAKSKSPDKAKRVAKSKPAIGTNKNNALLGSEVSNGTAKNNANHIKKVLREAWITSNAQDSSAKPSQEHEVVVNNVSPAKIAPEPTTHSHSKAQKTKKAKKSSQSRLSTTLDIIEKNALIQDEIANDSLIQLNNVKAQETKKTKKAKRSTKSDLEQSALELK